VRLSHPVIGYGLIRVHDDDAAQADDRQIAASPAQPVAWEWA